MKCSCKSEDLFNIGCRCGAFDFEISDHIWCNNILYAVARSAEEAITLCKEYLSAFEDFDPAWLQGEGWKIIPDNEELPLLIDDESDDEEIRLAWEWIEHYGPGFLAVV